ncbi:hypothetical protein DL93DRAFT_2172481 [Clavulina sp. PMI_390]|nr:hypothetical protein DL93DRAFT_2172481 [Clavulina sp. PMI_390]
MPIAVETAGPPTTNAAGGMNVAAALLNASQNAMLGAGGGAVPSAGGTLNVNPAMLGVPDLAGLDVQEQLELLSNRMGVETRIKEGAENLLQVLEADPSASPSHPSDPKDTQKDKDLLKQVRSELQASKLKIANLARRIDQVREELPGPSVRRPSLNNGRNGGVKYAPANGRRRNGSVSISAPIDFPRVKRPSAAEQGKSAHQATSTSLPQSNHSFRLYSFCIDADDIRTSLAHAHSLLTTITQLNTPYAPQSITPTHTSPSLAAFHPPGPPAGLAAAFPADTPPSVIKAHVAKRDRELIEAMNDLVTTFDRNVRVRWQVGVEGVCNAILPSLSDSSSKEARAAAYRVIRHAIVDYDSTAAFRRAGLDWALVRTLARDAKHGVEKEQAFKLIGTLLELARHYPYVSPPSGATSSAPNLPNAVFTPGAAPVPIPGSAPPAGTFTTSPPPFHAPAPHSAGFNQSPMVPPHSRSHSQHQYQQQRQADENERDEFDYFPLSDSVVRAVIAVAENAEDPFRLESLVLLGELLLFDPALAHRTGGLRPLLITLADASSANANQGQGGGQDPSSSSTAPNAIANLAPEIALALLSVVDRPATRAYLERGVDLEMALAGFTDAYGRGKGAANVERMRASGKVIVIMLRSWSGLMYLCMDDMKAIRSLVDTLRIRSLDTRDVILDMFFEVLKIKTPDWYNTFLEGRRLTMYRKRESHGHGHDHHEHSRNGPGGGNVAPHGALKLTDQFLALLLVIMSDAGLCDALMGILEEQDCDSNISRKATLLLGEILYMSNRLLPLSQAAKLQSLPQLFSKAAAYGGPMMTPSSSSTNSNPISAAFSSADKGKNDGKFGRELASTAFAAIDSFNRNRARLQNNSVGAGGGTGGGGVGAGGRRDLKRGRANSVEDTVRRDRRQVDQTRIQHILQMDDRTFQSFILDTQVMSQTSHTKWNFETLTALVEGPLLNPKRLEEALKGTRFGKKLMPFFWPRSGKFATLEKTPENAKWIQFACSWITVLVTSRDGAGIRFLGAEDALIPQLASCFAELLPFQGVPAVDPVFSAKKVETTLTSGYFDIIGVLSQYPEGVELMERHKLFTAFYHVTELRSRHDLIRAIIKCLDYTMDGHSRIVLSKALTSSTKDIRIDATKHLGQLIKASTPANEWTLRLLLTQLYDHDTDVASLAMRYLEDVCQDLGTLELVVKMQPTLDHMGDVGHSLLRKFMATSVGFRYLYHSDYIDRELESWFHDRNFVYVVQVETYLAWALGHTDAEDKRLPREVEDMVPAHFYGEMAKSALGSQVLAEKGHFSEFSYFIRQHGLEDDDIEIINKLKSVLWAVGNIGATVDGLLFLEEEELVPVIIQIAEESLVLSVRGTCFYVLGLVATTDQGADVLSEYGWEATMTPLRTATGLCLPQDIMRFLHIPPWDPPSSHSALGDLPDPLPSPEQVASGEYGHVHLSKRAATRINLQDHEREILDAISNLSNTVIANEAARSLSRLKTRYPASFHSVPFLAHIMRTLSTERYRLPVRRYVLDQLFGSSPPAAGGGAGAGGASSSSMGTAPAAPPPVDEGELILDAETMRALQDEARKLEREAQAWDEAQERRRMMVASGREEVDSPEAEMDMGSPKLYVKNPEGLDVDRARAELAAAAVHRWEDDMDATPIVNSEGRTSNPIPDPIRARAHTAPLPHTTTVGNMTSTTTTTTTPADITSPPPMNPAPVDPNANQHLPPLPPIPPPPAVDPSTAAAVAAERERRAGIRGSVLAKYAPVRKPQAPVGVPRMSGFDAGEPDVEG